MDDTPHRRQSVIRICTASGMPVPALSRVRHLCTCIGAAQARGRGGPPRGHFIPSFANYRNLSQTITPVCDSRGSTTTLHAAPSRENVCLKCIDTSAAVGHCKREWWCGWLTHWHTMTATSVRRQTFDVHAGRQRWQSRLCRSSASSARGLELDRRAGEAARFAVSPSESLPTINMTNYRKPLLFPEFVLKDRDRR